MTHAELCERARRWLRGTRRCEPVFSNIASCSEIPDAIGWSSCGGWEGSTVVECKISLSDFHADKKKRTAWRHPEFKDWVLKHRRVGSERDALAQGYVRVELPLMGDYRFYLCPLNLIPLAAVEKHAPDHGLLYVDGRRIVVVKNAPQRPNVHKDAEIRYLRFAIINGKEAYSGSSITGRVGLFEGVGDAGANSQPA